MDVDGRSLNQRLLPLLRVFFSSMSEESRANRSSDEVVITTSQEDVVFVPGEYKRTVLSERCEYSPVHDT